jgi:hypothetical protein
MEKNTGRRAGFVGDEEIVYGASPKNPIKENGHTLSGVLPERACVSAKKQISEEHCYELAGNLRR